MQKIYDATIQLGSQVTYLAEPATYQLAPHTALRTEGSAIAFKKGITKKLIIVGGSNFGVRYNDQEILKPAIFTFEAFADADFNRKSEAAVIKEFLVKNYGVPSNQILAETLSSTTKENAQFVKIMLQRRPMFNGSESLAIITLLYHMEDKVNEKGETTPGALTIFKEAGLNVDPLFAENLLADNDPSQIEKICQYYTTPKGGKQYDVDRIRKLLTEGKSLAEMMA